MDSSQLPYLEAMTWPVALISQVEVQEIHLTEVGPLL